MISPCLILQSVLILKLYDFCYLSLMNKSNHYFLSLLHSVCHQILLVDAQLISLM